MTKLNQFKTLVIDDFEEKVMIDSEEKLEKFLRKRPAFNANHFTLTLHEGGYPQLSFFVKNDLCVLYYFGEEKEEMCVSYGNLETYNYSEIFYENIMGEKVELAGENIVPINVMFEAAKYFFRVQECPNCLEWMEL